MFMMVMVNRWQQPTAASPFTAASRIFASNACSGNPCSKVISLTLLSRFRQSNDPNSLRECFTLRVWKAELFKEYLDCEQGKN